APSQLFPRLAWQALHGIRIASLMLDAVGLRSDRNLHAHHERRVMTNQPARFRSRAFLRSLVLPLSLSASLAIGACTSASGASPNVAPAPTIAVPAAAGSSSGLAAPVAASQQVNANSASQDEVQR